MSYARRNLEQIHLEVRVREAMVLMEFLLFESLQPTDAVAMEGMSALLGKLCPRGHRVFV